jgi:hypothetical protein
VLDDFPSDHWRHRGLFWAWRVVETEGKRYDLWMNMTVKDHSANRPAVTSSAKQARMETENLWQIDGREIVREGVRLTVFPRAGQRARVVSGDRMASPQGAGHPERWRPASASKYPTAP